MELTLIEIILSLFLIPIIVSLIILFQKTRKIVNNFNQLTKNVKSGNLEDLLREHLKRINKNIKQTSQIEEELKKFKNFTKQHIQKVGFKRFNPFHETGGNQSFILALLDGKNNGVIVSSLHQRETTRVYAKLIEEGECKHKLSKEESRVLQQTIN